ncbi:hypothetical protein EDD16DRAFT_288490 [Pisolithus croceorrhizus]|nr:hypothetical protein EDD16DRAFT_288490 [Pisolithus croceorrhizus]
MMLFLGFIYCLSTSPWDASFSTNYHPSLRLYIFIILVYTPQSTHLVSQQLGSGRKRAPKIRLWVFMATAIGGGLDLYRIPEHASPRRYPCTSTLHTPPSIPLLPRRFSTWLVVHFQRGDLDNTPLSPLSAHSRRCFVLILVLFVFLFTFSSSRTTARECKEQTGPFVFHTSVQKQQNPRVLVYELNPIGLI